MSRRKCAACGGKGYVDDEGWADGPLGPMVGYYPGCDACDGDGRRALSRATCGAGGCDLRPAHAGVHRAVCGCVSGCAATGCPNGKTL